MWEAAALVAKSKKILEFYASEDMIDQAQLRRASMRLQDANRALRIAVQKAQAAEHAPLTSAMCVVQTGF